MKIRIKFLVLAMLPEERSGQSMIRFRCWTLGLSSKEISLYEKMSHILCNGPPKVEPITVALSAQLKYFLIYLLKFFLLGRLQIFIVFAEAEESDLYYR